MQVSSSNKPRLIFYHNAAISTMLWGQELKWNCIPAWKSSWKHLIPTRHRGKLPLSSGKIEFLLSNPHPWGHWAAFPGQALPQGSSLGETAVLGHRNAAGMELRAQKPWRQQLGDNKVGWEEVTGGQHKQRVTDTLERVSQNEGEKPRTQSWKWNVKKWKWKVKVCISHCSPAMGIFPPSWADLSPLCTTKLGGVKKSWGRLKIYYKTAGPLSKVSSLLTIYSWNFLFYQYITSKKGKLQPSQMTLHPPPLFLLLYLSMHLLLKNVLNHHEEVSSAQRITF